MNTFALRVPLLAVALSAALSAQAAPDLTLLTPNVTVVRPATGSVTYDFVGTVLTDPGTVVTGAALFFPSMNGSFLTGSYDAGTLAAQSSYTGTLFSIVVTSTRPVGLYAASAESPDGHSAFTVTEGVNVTAPGATTIADYSVTIVATPEPSALAALGLGAVAFLKRRRKA